MPVKVIAPGLATTVQDLGRPGYYHLGIPISGGMDRLALRAANMLVGNDEGAATLEAVFMGPELEFKRDASVAVTGAELTPKVDGEARETWTSFRVKSGQVLSFEFLKAGARAYIAISGGIDVPVVLGSRSTYPLGALGGFKGRSLQAGDELPLGASNGAKEGRTIAENLRRMPGKPAELRMLPGLYWHRITGGIGHGLLRRHLEGGAGGRPHRLSLPLRPSAQVRRAQAAFRRRLRSVEHRRRLLPLRLDPGAGRHRADRAPPRRRFRRRLFHDRHGHLGRHGSDRPAAAAHGGEIREGRHADGTPGPA